MLIALAFFLVSAADADAAQCPAGTVLVGTRDEDTGSEIITHVICQEVAQPKPPQAARQADSCAVVRERADRERAAIEQLQRTNESNQEELADWSKMNAQSQKDALWAALDFAGDYYTANLKETEAAVGKLERNVAELDKHAVHSRKHATRLKYLADLRAAEAELAPAKVQLVSKRVIESAASAKEAWELSRNTLHHEFNVAAKRNENIRELLQDKNFRDAFMGDEDAPGMAVVSDLADEAAKELIENSGILERYAGLTGPIVPAAKFVREETYNAIASILSTRRTLQDSNVAGELAKASGALQARYHDTIDALKACRSN